MKRSIETYKLFIISMKIPARANGFITHKTTFFQHALQQKEEVVQGNAVCFRLYTVVKRTTNVQSSITTVSNGVLPVTITRPTESGEIAKNRRVRHVHS